MVCSQCRTDNPAENRFCGSCGAPLPESDAPVNQAADAEGVYHCFRHSRATTRVRCGRCERPICSRCTVHGPAGVRCRDCARSRVPVRPMGVLHEAGRALDPSGATGRTVWYLAIWAFVISIFSGIFGGRRDL